MKKTFTLQKQATIVASCVAFFLTIVKFFVGIISGSIVILSSAIDSLLDLMISVFNFYAVHTAEKEPDASYNYGRGKIEALASFFEGIIIVLSGVFILYESIKKLYLQESLERIDLSIAVMIFSVVMTAVLVLYLKEIYKKTENLVVASDMLHYKMDLLSNGAILIALIFIYVTNFLFIDAILGIWIAIYIIYSAVNILKKWYHLLLDVAISEKEVEKIVQYIQENPKISTFHALKTRESGERKFVEAHLVFSRDISLFEAHEISHNIEKKIQQISTESKWSVVFHLEPYDDSEEDL